MGGIITTPEAQVEPLSIILKRIKEVEAMGHGEIRIFVKNGAIFRIEKLESTMISSA